MIETGKLLQQRYRIDKQIGQGGMGAVYVATDERFGSTVAIKETLCMDDNYRKAIEREARLLNSLKHVALPRVTDHFLEENGQFLVMEYISGEDLHHIMESTNAPFPVDQVLTWADQLLDALDFLHNQVNPVIHRDIKPQNLKVTPKGQIILLDFGLAKGNPTDAGHQTAAKSIFGYSRNYASLEQIQGTGTDPRSDLYSLAATVYHLLTNRPPEDALTRAMAVLSHRPDPLIPANQINPDIPAGVAGVLHAALALNAGQRPASAAEMQSMLRDHQQFEHLAATSATAAAVAAPLQTEIFSQRTKIMPGSTIHDGGRLTDVKTEVLPQQLSQVTALKGATGNTDPGVSGRRFGLGAVAMAGIMLAGTVAGGVYLFEPALFGGSDTVEEQPAAEALPVEASIPQPAVNSVVANIEVPAEAASSNSISPKTGASTEAKPVETTKSGRPEPETNKEPVLKPGQVIVDGDTIYMGNTKIVNGRIETPDGVIDENGVMRRTPPVPGVEPPARSMPMPDLRHLTPEQRRRVLRTLRRNVVLPRPTP